MKNSKFLAWKSLSLNWLQVTAVALLALGIFFRAVNIEKKAYWYDETFTSLQLSGYTPDEITQEILDGRTLRLEDLQKYQYPNSQKSALDTVKGVAKIEPQLTPLYFVMVRFWVQCFGHSIAAIRSFSAAISLLVFPCVYWLCLELFQSPLTGWMAVALMAVSPFHVLYAQEARPYSLWTVAILLSSASLLRAMRLQTKRSWALYGITVILGLHSFLFSILVSLAHGIYVVLSQEFRFSKTLTDYLIASALGLLTFAPWIFIVLISLPEIAGDTDWRSQKISLPYQILGWVRSISLFFVDFNLNSRSQLIYTIPFSVLLLLLLIIAAYSIYFLCRHTTQKVWLFVLTLMAVPALSLILPDLILGGQRSLVTRYLIPSFLAVQLAVAYLLATQVTNVSLNLRQHQLWKLVTVALISVGVLSCALISQSEVWWTKADDNIHHKLAAIINQSRQPLVISDTWLVRVLSLSHQLDPKVQFKLAVAPETPEITEGYSDVFLYKPSPHLKEEIEKTNQIVSVGSQLWKVTKK
jgi:uncharacterized membrane protein